MPPFVPDWYEVFPSGGPPSFTYNAAGCFDTARNRFVLYGGRGSAGGLVTDLRTWELYGGAWHAVTTAHQPVIQDGTHAPFESVWMVFDEARGVSVLNYWNLESGPVTNTCRTWEYDGTDWTEFTGSSPFKILSAAAYDPVGSQIVMWGGTGDGTGTLLPHTADLDYYTYEGTAWTHHTTANGPVRRDRPAFVYDQANANFLMIGGFTGDSSDSWWPNTLRPNDTWTLDLSGTPDWTQESPAVDPYPNTGSTSEFAEALGAGSYAEDLNTVIVTIPFGTHQTTFFWDGTNWSDPAPAVSPYPSEGIQNWNPEYNKTMYYGGFHTTARTDVWLYPSEPPSEAIVQVMRWW